MESDSSALDPDTARSDSQAQADTNEAHMTMLLPSSVTTNEISASKDPVDVKFDSTPDVAEAASKNEKTEQQRRKTRATVKQERKQLEQELAGTTGLIGTAMRLSRDEVLRKAHSRYETDNDFYHAIISEGTLNPYSEAHIKVGADYQVVVPPYSPPDPQQPTVERSTCVWNASLAEKLDSDQLAAYCSMARDQYCYSVEQSLGVLHLCDYDINMAIKQLEGFVPLRDQWTAPDLVIFERAIILSGKNFPKIHTLLPHKTVAALVEHYYLWKKSRSLTNYGDQSSSGEEEEEDSSDSAENTSSAPVAVLSATAERRMRRQRTTTTGRTAPARSIYCVNCAHSCPVPQQTPVGPLCAHCHLYWKRTGSMRPAKRPRLVDGVNDRNKGARCPKGYEKLTADFFDFANQVERETDFASMTDPQDKMNLITVNGEKYLKTINTRIEGTKLRVHSAQTMMHAEYSKSLLDGVDAYRRRATASNDTRPRQRHVGFRWSNEETFLALQGFRKYGTNFDAIAEVIESKTKDMVQSFFEENRVRCRPLIEEYKAQMRREAEIDEASNVDEKKPSEDNAAVIDIDNEHVAKRPAAKLDLHEEQEIVLE